MFFAVFVCSVIMLPCSVDLYFLAKPITLFDVKGNIDYLFLIF